MKLFKKYFNCKTLWHKWRPVFIKAKYNSEQIKFIACYCERCYKWKDWVTDINNIWKDRVYWTYSEEYYWK